MSGAIVVAIYALVVAGLLWLDNRSRRKLDSLHQQQVDALLKSCDSWKGMARDWRALALEVIKEHDPGRHDEICRRIAEVEVGGLIERAKH